MFYCICLTTRNENLRDRPHERPIFQGFCVSPRRQRSWQHCQQLGDLLRVAGGVGSDATAETVDGRAKAMQLRDKRSRLIATLNCRSDVEADDCGHALTPPRKFCRARCRATPRLAARTTSSATLVRSRMEPDWTLGTANHAKALISDSSFLIVERISSNEGYSP